MKPLIVSHGGNESSFTICKVDRSKLYGKTSREPVNNEGSPVETAALTDDGAHILRSGMTSRAHFTPDGVWVQSSDMVAIDKEGGIVERKESTMGVAQELHEASLQELFDLRVESAYHLTSEDVSESLASHLSTGSIFSCDFRYRAGTKTSTLLLLSSGGKIYALVGQAAKPEWVGPSEEVPLADEPDELDFSMI